MRMKSTLYRGNVNPEMLVTFVCKYELSGQYPTLRKKDNDLYVLNPSFGMSISEGFNKPNIYITQKTWFTFVTLLEKAIKKISDNLYEIFPDIGSADMKEIDSNTLRRFQTEEALSSGGFTMFPDLWIDQTSQTFPGIRISSVSSQMFIRVPLEDCIPLAKMLNSFDPNTYGCHMLHILSELS